MMVPNVGLSEMLSPCFELPDLIFTFKIAMQILLWEFIEVVLGSLIVLEIYTVNRVAGGKMH